MAVLLALGIFYVWRYEYEQPSARETSEKEKQGEKNEPVFAHLNRDSIDRLEIQHDGASFTLERVAGDISETKQKSSPGMYENTRWVLADPKGATTDRVALRSLLNTLVGLTSHNTIIGAEVEKDQDIYGLSQPELRLVFHDGSGEHTLLFGKQHSFSGRRYAQLQGNERIFLVDDSSFQALNKTKDEVRDRHPIKFQLDKVREFQVTGSRVSGKGPTDGLVLTKDPARDSWQIGYQRSLNNITVDADGVLVKEILSGLLHLTVKQFENPLTPAQGTLSSYGLDTPKLRVEIRSFPDGSLTQNAQMLAGKQEESLVLLFGEHERTATVPKEPEEGASSITEYYFQIQGNDSVFEFSAKGAKGRFYTQLQQPLDFFREKTPFKNIQPQQITKVTVTKRPQLGKIEDRFSLVQKTNGRGNVEWKFIREANSPALTKAQKQNSAPFSKNANTQKVEEWLEKITHLQVLSFLTENLDLEEETHMASTLDIEFTTDQAYFALAFKEPVVPVNNEGKHAVEKHLPLEGQPASNDPLKRETPPRYGIVVLKGGEKKQVVLSFADWVDLNRSEAFFVGEVESTSVLTY